MLASARGTLQSARDAAKSLGGALGPPAPQLAAGPDLTLPQLLGALEGHSVQLHSAPDIRATILAVAAPEGPEGPEATDLRSFTLPGIKCRARLDVVGTAGQLAKMAARTAKGVVDKATSLTGVRIGQSIGERSAAVQDAAAKRAAAEAEVKSTECWVRDVLEAHGC